MLDPKVLQRSLGNLIRRLDGKRTSLLEDQVCDIVCSETATAFALSVFMRSLTYSWLMEHPESQLVGNELSCVGDFNVDARGTVLSALAFSVDLTVTVWYATGHTTPALQDYTKHAYNEDCEEKLDIVVTRTKTILIEPQVEYNKENKAESTVDLLERRISRVDSEKKLGHKNCNKCGRIKLEKFCVCRKLGQRDISVQRQLAESTITGTSSSKSKHQSQMAA